MAAPLPFSQAHLCSTPNGIKGTYTREFLTAHQLQDWCSTPNGIKGTYTLQ